MKIGYARVSTREQNLDRQIDALNAAGCEKIFSDKISGAKFDRPELQMMQSQLREGDIVVIDKLDRLGRSLKDLISIVQGFEDRGVSFISLKDNMDTSTPSGKLIFHIFASLAEFERALISERTKSGLAAAKARGRLGGRRPGLTDNAKRTAMAAETLYKTGEYSVSQMCEQLGISRPTLYSYLRSRDVGIGAN
ncbi:MAG: recombinase family protein [Saprospiraceae bacterium]|nr:recombinase family protein [Saprospiraceae bacterium]